jgi:hypothetical protein
MQCHVTELVLARYFQGAEYDMSFLHVAVVPCMPLAQ